MSFTKGHTLWKHPNCKKSQFKSGTSVRVGMKHSDESKLKVSESRKGKATGANNPSWKGGVTKLLTKIKRLTEYKTWQKRVFERDNYTCRACFQRGGLNLTAHHLSSFSYITRILGIKDVEQARETMMLWNVRNGVTLCQECHKQTPNYSWRANKTPRDRTIYKAAVVGLLLLIFGVPNNLNAATFGYTSAGASYGWYGSRMIGRVSSPSETGTLDSISAYTDQNGYSSASKCALYSGTASPASLVSNTTSEENTFSHTDPAWQTYAVSSGASLSVSTTYWIVIWGAGATANTRLAYDSGSSGASRFSDLAYTSFPSTRTYTESSRFYSTYATYTTGGGGGGGEGTVVQDIFWFD